MSDISSLVLGWKMTPDFHPRYWLNKNAKPGSQSDQDLITIPADLMSSHSVIVARSGSGKSFFLGRLLEEILIRTHANCVILDPNGDFRKIHMVKDREIWTKAGYNPHSYKGILPHEAMQASFESKWRNIRGAVLTNDMRLCLRDCFYHPLRLWWPSFRMDLITDALPYSLQMEVQQFHFLVRILYQLVVLQNASQNRNDNPLGIVEEIVSEIQRSKSTIQTILEFHFNADTIASQLTSANMLHFAGFEFNGPEAYKYKKTFLDNLIKSANSYSESLSHFVTNEAIRVYFLLAQEWELLGIMSSKYVDAFAYNGRLLVMDLPSMKDIKSRIISTSMLLSRVVESAQAEWASAMSISEEDDSRVPTFIVVDEAHNFIPSDSPSKATVLLREQFRTIAGEGRKYGLFLILVTQRPDKLDPITVSECENKAIMRIDSKSVHDLTRKLLAIEDVQPSVTNKCLRFPQGRVLLIGKWAPEKPIFLCSALRRTEEGGRNLRPQCWAVEDS